MDICTVAAQAELVGPAVLAIFAPIIVGFLLGPYALGGFLVGMILLGLNPQVIGRAIKSSQRPTPDLVDRVPRRHRRKIKL